MTPQEFLRDYAHFYSKKEETASRMAEEINRKLTESSVEVTHAHFMGTWCLQLKNAEKYS